jgi:transposase
MEKNLLQVGVDVDDQAFHFSCVDVSGEIICKGIRSLPSAGKLLKLIKKHVGERPFEVGYEATYLGYSLKRELQRLGCACKVIAPTSIKSSPNDRVKNDRIDSLRLAQGMYRQEFSYVATPSRDQEADRQMIRARSFLVSQRSDLKRHILSQCRLMGLDYKAETSAKEYWTLKHRNWLDTKIKTLPQSIHIAFSCLLMNLENIESQLDTLEAEIDHISQKKDYKSTAEALCCFKGISQITAMTLITEIFDIKRFDHPRKLVAFSGLDIREYSSGGKQQQYGISKMGNRRLRTALVESCQKFATSKKPSKRKVAARAGADPRAIELANRCQERLYKKGHRLLAREKNRNKIKVACAREMIGFIWEAMNLAA